MMAHNQAALELAANWVKWLDTRKFLAPPMPPSILAALIGGSRKGNEPDGVMDAEMQAFNTACIAQEREMLVPFVVVYARVQPKNTPVKKIAYDLDISTATFYRNAHQAATKIVTMTRRLSRNVR
jgi:hypothetical protein